MIEHCHSWVYSNTHINIFGTFEFIASFHARLKDLVCIEL